MAASALVAKIVDFVITRFVIQFTRRSTNTLDDQIVASLHRPIFVTVFFIGLQVAIPYLGLPERAAGLLNSAMLSIVVVVWVVALFKMTDSVLRDISRMPDRATYLDHKTYPLFTNLAKMLVIAFALYGFMLVWRVNPGAWLASAGVAGLAIGFAAKDTLANLFSGIFIMADAPYQVGDYVNLDSGERGEVSHIGLRSTRLLTRDNVEITVPNAVIANAKLINESRGSATLRVRCKIGVAYGSDLDQVVDVLQKVGDAHPESQECRVRCRTFADSGIEYEVLVFIGDPAKRGVVLHELNTAAYNALGEAGIEIPFPKRDLYIKEMPGSDPAEN